MKNLGMNKVSNMIYHLFILLEHSMSEFEPKILSEYRSVLKLKGPANSKNNVKLPPRSKRSIGMGAISLIKNFVSKMSIQRGQKQTKLKRTNKEIINMFDHPKFLSNPLMSSYFLLKNKTNFFLRKGIYIDTKRVETWKQIKVSVLNAMNHYILFEHQLHLEKVINWFGTNILPQKENNNNNHQFLKAQIKKELKKEEANAILPKTASINISVNLQTAPVSLQNSHLDWQYIIKNGNATKVCSSLPLILIFMTSSEEVLEMEISKLICRVFDQNSSFIEYLSQLELILTPKQEKEFFQLKDKNKWLDYEGSKLRENLENNIINFADLKSMGSEINSMAILLVENNENNEINLSINNEIELIIISTKNQNIHRFLGCHESILHITKTLTRYFVGFSEFFDKDDELVQKLIFVIKKCLTYLTLFCRQNKKNIAALKKCITQILTTCRTDLYQMDLYMALNEHSIKAEFIIGDFVKLIRTFGRKSQFLRILELLTKDKNNDYANNQKSFIDLITNLNSLDNLRETQFILYMKATNKELVFDFEQAEQFKNNSRSEFIDEPYLYHYRLFKILLDCSKGIIRLKRYGFKKTNKKGTQHKFAIKDART